MAKIKIGNINGRNIYVGNPAELREANITLRRKEMLQAAFMSNLAANLSLCAIVARNTWNLICRKSVSSRHVTERKKSLFLRKDMTASARLHIISQSLRKRTRSRLPRTVSPRLRLARTMTVLMILQ